MNSVIILVFLQGILVSDVLLMRTRTWLMSGNTNFNNSLNWDLGRVPCSQDNVIFPRRMSFVVRLPEGETILRQLVLPPDGELLLPFNGKLLMSNLNDNSDECHGKDTIVFTKWNIPSWMDPKSWSGNNPATPDFEAIPCQTDSVVFPKESSFSVVMPDTPVVVAALSIDGKQIENRGWSELMSTEEGQMQFFTKSGKPPEIIITSKPCTDVTGCICNPFLPSTVCKDLAPHCKVPPCLDPVSPIGYCCPICGAYLIFGYTNKFSILKFNKYVEEKLSYVKDKVDFHISKFHVVQVVLIEKGDYEERIQSIAEQLQEDIRRGDLGLKSVTLFEAGTLVSPPSLSRQAFLFFSFMIIAICMTALLFYIYTDACNVNQVEGFVVFENLSEEVELRRPKKATQTSNTSQRQAFDNPMYGSTAEVDLVDQEATEEYPIYSVLEDIKHDKDDFEDQLLSEEVSAESDN
ncbi:amnion associated transmembrane protein [Lycorma delicatula]|uniref:amnion associated transmembrane protein n=1 Tax=Lycorma delicatula TaxID=130591 RepID=UPI003F516A34